MHKKLAATLTIAIFLISTLAIIVPAQASFTLGNMSGTNPYEIRNFDPHVAGPIGWVWPGAGENAWLGVPNYASDNLPPGYQSPYPSGNPPGAPSNSWYQLEGDTYAPFGAILTNSTGDLIFGLNATCSPNYWSRPKPCSTEFDPAGNGVVKSEIQTPGCPAGISAPTCLAEFNGWDTWMILIPPEFTVPGASSFDSSQIVSTLTNNYAGVFVGKLGPDDRYAPGWTLVAITADAAIDCFPFNPSGLSAGCNIGYSHQYITFTHAREWYYVRINGVTAPSVAGRYFFKMALYSSSNTYGVGPTLAGGTGFPGPGPTENPFVWVPPQNWPVVLVKGEIDPAIITGTLRYAGYNSTLYQQPIAEAGMVTAKMTMRLDPYTGVQRPDLPTIDGQGFVNATANGHYEVEGLAPGVYDIYAEAAGYPQTLCVSGITVLKGQSLHFDCYLQPGPVIHGNVFTKHQFGDEPWPENATTGSYMKIELYTNPTLSNIVDPSAGAPVSWSPLPCTAGGQELYYGRRAAGLCGDPHDGSAIAFPWHEYSTINGLAYNDPNIFTGLTNHYIRDVAESKACYGPNAVINGQTTTLPCQLTSDPEGVGPPQQWYVQGGTTNPFHFEFGLKGEYGAPRDLSGEVPQVYATWINGLTPGRYYVRAWTFRYVQTALDGLTFQEYYFDITPNEWAGDVTLPIDLRLSSWVNKTVYFHDTLSTITTSPVHSGAGYIWGQLVGADGHVYSANVTGLGLLENVTAVGTERYPNPPKAKPTLQPFYYYSNGCFSYDQYSYGFASANGNIFPFTGETGAPAQRCPGGQYGPATGLGSGGEGSSLDKSALNGNSIATGRATIQFWGINDTWGGENYGIPSGTYTPSIEVNGYYSPTPAEQVSVALSGTPTTVSDHLFLGPGFNVTIYSIDWERPRVSRNWVWSGCQDNELAQNDYYNPYTANPFAGAPYPCVGSEIDVGWYPLVNGTAGALADYFGPETTFQPPSVNFVNDFGGLFQGPGGIDCLTGFQPAFTCSEMDGGGRNVLQGYQLAHDAYFGQSARYAFVGGYTSGSFGFLRATTLLKDSMFTCAIVCTPLHFSEGAYNLAAYTYGYIQDKDFTAYAMNGQVADMKVNLIIGVNVTLDILFKKESIITGTPYNMSARVRLFNDQNQLVATWMSSEGVYVDKPGHAVAANGILPSFGGADAMGSGAFPLYPFITGGGSPYTVVQSWKNSYNYLPGGVNELHVVMAGFPQEVPLGSNIVGVYFGDPVFTPSSCDFELDCYPANYAQYPFPYTGIEGAPDYTGGWTAEVDFVPWYTNNTVSTLGGPYTDYTFIPDKPVSLIRADITSTPIAPPVNHAFMPALPGFIGCLANGKNCGGQYYPPVTGLLLGESYHIIPGTTATSGISLTEDASLSSTFLGHSMAPNHLGPYSQEGVWQIAGTHNSGEASAIFEVDLNGFLSGAVYAFTWSNEFRTISWAAITVTGASGATFPFYTWDGISEGFFPPGQYTFTVSAPGYVSQTYPISVSPGEVSTASNAFLEESNIPIPEFSGVAVMAFSALAASVYLLRRRRE